MTDFLYDARIPQRIWDKIVPEPNSGCWLWDGSISGSGQPYGEAWLDNHKVKSHRGLYVTLVGKVPPWHDLDHKCRVTLCCNPDHLEPVTRSENNKRGNTGLNAVKFWQEAETCPRGHKWTPENTDSNGKWRRCRTCKNARSRWLRAGKIGTVEDYL